MREFIQDVKSLRFLFSKWDKYKLLALFGLMVIGAVLEAISVGAIPAFVAMVMQPSSLAELRWVGHWFTGLPDQITVELLLWASGLLLLFIILKNIFLTYVFYVQAKIVNTLRVRLGDRMFKTYQEAPFEWHLLRSSSDLLRSIQNDTAQVLAAVVMPILNLSMAIIMSAVIIAVLVFSTPGVTLLALLVTGVGLFIAVRTFQKRLKNIGQLTWSEHQKMIQAIQQGFGSLVDARIIGCEEYLRQQHHASLLRFAKAQLQQQVIVKFTPYTMETFAVLGLLVIFAILINGAESIAATLPIIALLGVVLLRLKQMATQIAGSINQLNVGRQFIPAIVKDIGELNTIQLRRRTLESKENLIEAFEKLELENVSYNYPDTESAAVSDINLTLNKGESIALVGATGSGKSTLVSLMLGLLEPGSGRVLVNGIDVRRDLKGWYRNLGYIPQTIYLIDDSIQANIAFGVPEDDVDEERVWMALKSASLDDFVESQPQGLHTMVGERGVRLSGGQRQRLGIARALYQRPSVLIMDEATSALDNRTEDLVMKAIQEIKQDCTLVMIAHRLSTVQNCDRLYCLEEGNIVSVGSYAELTEYSDAFNKMAGIITGR